MNHGDAAAGDADLRSSARAPLGTRSASARTRRGAIRRSASPAPGPGTTTMETSSGPTRSRRRGASPRRTRASVRVGTTRRAVLAGRIRGAAAAGRESRIIPRRRRASPREHDHQKMGGPRGGAPPRRRERRERGGLRVEGVSGRARGRRGRGSIGEGASAATARGGVSGPQRARRPRAAIRTARQGPERRVRGARSPRRASFDASPAAATRIVRGDESRRYLRALDRAPQCAGAWYGLALVQRSLGDTVAALRALDRALSARADGSLDGDELPGAAWNARARTLLRAGRVAAADADFRRAVLCDRANPIYAGNARALALAVRAHAEELDRAAAAAPGGKVSEPENNVSGVPRGLEPSFLGFVGLAEASEFRGVGRSRVVSAARRKAEERREEELKKDLRESRAPRRASPGRRRRRRRGADRVESSIARAPRRSSPINVLKNQVRPRARARLE